MKAAYDFIASLLFFVMMTSCIGVFVTTLLMFLPLLNNVFRKRMTAKEFYSLLSPWHRKWHFIFLWSFGGSFVLLIILAVISG